MIGILEEILHHNTLAIFALALLLLLFPSMKIVFRGGVKNIKVSLVGITDFQYACHIPAPVAVVWCAPYRTQLVVVKNLIPFLA